MPEDVNVHSAFEKAPTATSSQLVATSQPANTAPIFSQKDLEVSQRETTDIEMQSIDASLTAHSPKGDLSSDPIQSTLSTLETAKLLYGMSANITSISGSPQSPHQSEDETPPIAMVVDTTLPIQIDEEGPGSLSPIFEIQGTTEATTTLLPSSCGLEDSSFIAKTSVVATADEGSKPDAGSPQYQEKKGHMRLQVWAWLMIKLILSGIQMIPLIW